MTRSFLGELYAGGESEFGVDVGEVGLHGETKSRVAMSLLASPSLTSRYDVALGGGERGPAAGDGKADEQCKTTANRSKPSIISAA